MGCQPTKCPNCGANRKACELKRAENGKQCCTICVAKYNLDNPAPKK